MERVDEDEYRSYVMARMDRLQRAAYLLCRDWHTAEDLVAVTFGKLYRNWSRAQQADSLDAYVRTILMRSWLDEARPRQQLFDGHLVVAHLHRPPQAPTRIHRRGVMVALTCINPDPDQLPGHPLVLPRTQASPTDDPACMSLESDQLAQISINGQGVQNGRVASLLEPRATTRHQPRPTAPGIQSNPLQTPQP